jgi:hypothetical protein
MKLEALPHRDYTSCPLLENSQVVFKEVASICVENHRKHRSTWSEKDTEI